MVLCRQISRTTDAADAATAPPLRALRTVIIFPRFNDMLLAPTPPPHAPSSGTSDPAPSAVHLSSRPGCEAPPSMATNWFCWRCSQRTLGVLALGVALQPGQFQPRTALCVFYCVEQRLVCVWGGGCVSLGNQQILFSTRGFRAALIKASRAQ